MTEIYVKKHTRRPDEVHTVVWTGDPAEGRLLQQHGWISGMDTGFDRDAAGNDVLRGIVETPWGQQNAFPGDFIVQEDGRRSVWERSVFEKHFSSPESSMMLTNEEEPARLDSPVPTGDNPNAVNLDVEPEAINRLITDDQLRMMAINADKPGDQGEEAEFELNALLLHNGWDPDADSSETWSAMIENVIASKMTIEPIPETEATVGPEDDETIEEEDDEEIEDEDDDEEDDDSE